MYPENLSLAQKGIFLAFEDVGRYSGADPIKEGAFSLSSNLSLCRAIASREVFDTLLEAKVLVERWRREYNHIRLHSSLGYRPPALEVIIPMGA